MRALVTGATGFLGSRVAAALVAAGEQVIAALRPSSDRSRLPAKVAIRQTSDPRALCEGVDAIVHLACCYGRAGEAVAEVAEANFHAPLRLLDAAMRTGVRAFVSTGTSLPPETSPYALTKRQFADYGRTSTRGRLAFVDLRLEQFYGPGEDAGRIVALLVGACVRGEARLALTPGEQVRDLLYVDDAVAAVIAAARAAAAAPREPLQLEAGTGEGIAIRDLAELIKRLSGAATALDFGAIPYRANEPMRLVADIAALQRLGWKPQVSLEEGLRRTIAAAREASWAGS
jgi:nucleoside-diphosphate-sugar epimerase